MRAHEACSFVASMVNAATGGDNIQHVGAGPLICMYIRIIHILQTNTMYTERRPHPPHFHTPTDQTFQQMHSLSWSPGRHPKKTTAPYLQLT
jgi:hypothetical protein